MANSYNKYGKKSKKQLHYPLHEKKCFIATHTISGSETNSNGNIPLNIFVPGNTSRVIFENFTNSHNKTLLQLHVPFPVDDRRIEVTIQTRNSHIPIITTLVPGETKVFQVENFQSLTFTNNNKKSSFITIFIKKTFCICCTNQNDYSKNQKGTYFIETHTIAGSQTNSNGNIPLNFFIGSNTSKTAFEDFTNNHNESLIQISVLNLFGAIEVTIQTRNSHIPITAKLESPETRIFQIEDFQSLTLTNNSLDDQIIDIFIQKTFCIYCNNRNNSCDEYYCKCED
ncbi:exosporium protein D [Bacillus sp. AR8-1]|uniref:exosporium protein D n=1 Tax=Bacillus sp. AR8-1 TaxID=2217826 RepID=UPI0011CC158A|nr:exosporium protein D [Bacillus sp. AR8-1]TXR76958.1 exosporium protein D [Bacillus sp. AR8-1]